MIFQSIKHKRINLNLMKKIKETTLFVKKYGDSFLIMKRLFTWLQFFINKLFL
jgi:hypothetical protein